VNARSPPHPWRTAPVLVVLLTTGARAYAQGTDSIAAESLFEEGRELMQAGDYAHACPKLEASQRLDPGVGTLLNLGDCLEKSGQTASAWVRFREAASAAVSAGQREREIIARDRVEALAPRLCRMRINVGAGAVEPGGAVERDGVLVDRAVWGQAIPVDPGPHTLRASAPGKRPWSAVANLDGSACPGTTQIVDVPSLEDDPSTAARPGAPDAVVGTSRWGVQRQLALSAGAVAVAAAAVGTGLAIGARSSYEDAKARCTSLGCPATNAGTMADYATGASVVAGVAALAGLALWFTAPSHVVTIAPHAVGRAGAGIAAMGTFP
jgi:hypothetical protein